VIEQSQDTNAKNGSPDKALLLGMEEATAKNGDAAKSLTSSSRSSGTSTSFPSKDAREAERLLRPLRTRNGQGRGIRALARNSGRAS
jgi:hypothetical protein